jgi:hypothetical protein
MRFFMRSDVSRSAFAPTIGRRGVSFVQVISVLYDVPARAAEACRPHDGAPAVTVKNALPAHQVFFPDTLAQAHPVADVGGQLGLEKGAHSSAKCFLFGGVFQVHARFSMPSLWHQAARRAVLLATTY